MSFITDGFDSFLYNFVFKIFYMFEILLCRAISWTQSFYDIFTGTEKVEYNGNPEYLIDVFFGNSIITAVYWGMAIIGIMLSFIFAIVSVTKKAADLDEKVKQSHGQILRSLLRSILLIVSMNIVITVVVSSTTALMVSVNEAFNYGENHSNGKKHIVYTDEQYAAMSRIFNTVGNYSLNPSYNNRYNLNSCYNEIRTDLKYLGDTHVFDFYYKTLDANDEVIDTWQSVLLEIAMASDYTKDVDVDEYNEAVSAALNHCMTVLRTTPNFTALQEYTRDDVYVQEKLAIDRLIFLIGTMGAGNTAAARTDLYNENPALTDNVRGPYYSGEKDIYDFDEVNKDFDISFTKTNYLVVYFASIAILVNMIMIVVNCIVRLFNLLFMYLIAPPIIAVSPLDDGAKFKQWTTAFIVQAFSVFATVISMRLFLIYVPIVMSPNLVLLDNNLLNTIGKLLMIWAGIKAIEKSNGLLTGILADNAGWQSIQAGDMRDTVKNSKAGRMAASVKEGFEKTVTAPVRGAASLAGGAAKGIASLPFKPITGAFSNAKSRISNAFSNLGKSIGGSIINSPEQVKEKEESQKKNSEEAKKKKEQQQQNQALAGMIGGAVANALKPPPPPRPGNNNNNNNKNPNPAEGNNNNNNNNNNNKNNQIPAGNNNLAGDNNNGNNDNNNNNNNDLPGGNNNLNNNNAGFGISGPGNDVGVNDADGNKGEANDLPDNQNAAVPKAGADGQGGNAGVEKNAQGTGNKPKRSLFSPEGKAEFKAKQDAKNQNLPGNQNAAVPKAGADGQGGNAGAEKNAQGTGNKPKRSLFSPEGKAEFKAKQDAKNQDLPGNQNAAVPKADNNEQNNDGQPKEGEQNKLPDNQNDVVPKVDDNGQPKENEQNKLPGNQNAAVPKADANAQGKGTDAKPKRSLFAPKPQDKPNDQKGNAGDKNKLPGNQHAAVPKADAHGQAQNDKVAKSYKDAEQYPKTFGNVKGKQGGLGAAGGQNDAGRNADQNGNDDGKKKLPENQNVAGKADAPVQPQNDQVAKSYKDAEQYPKTFGNVKGKQGGLGAAGGQNDAGRNADQNGNDDGKKKLPENQNVAGKADAPVQPQNDQVAKSYKDAEQYPKTFGNVQGKQGGLVAAGGQNEVGRNAGQNVANNQQPVVQGNNTDVKPAQNQLNNNQNQQIQPNRQPPPVQRAVQENRNMAPRYEDLINETPGNPDAEIKPLPRNNK